jgi:hypothetical protein
MDDSSNTASQTTHITENDRAEAKVVHVMIEFLRIGEIDTMNEKYQAELYIESRWTDNSLVEEELKGKSNLPIYDAKKHWNPQLVIENSLQEPKENIKYEVSKDNSGNLVVTEIRYVKGKNLKKKKKIIR